jgi:hypothetical protein
MKFLRQDIWLMREKSSIYCFIILISSHKLNPSSFLRI